MARSSLMNTPTNSESPKRNRILAALPAEEYERLAPHLEHVELPLGETLYHPDERIEHVYFPLRGTVSLTAVMENGGEVEVGVVGHEGMVGLSVMLGTDSAPFRAVV